MKIIKHGNTYVQPQIIKCYCECEFEIEDSDIDKKYLQFAKVYQYYIRCPECNRVIILDEQYDEESPEQKRDKQFKEFYEKVKNNHR